MCVCVTFEKHEKQGDIKFELNLACTDPVIRINRDVFYRNKEQTIGIISSRLTRPTQFISNNKQVFCEAWYKSLQSFERRLFIESRKPGFKMNT